MLATGVTLTEKWKRRGAVLSSVNLDPDRLAQTQDIQ